MQTDDLNTGVDVTEVPTPAETAGNGADERPDNLADQPAGGGERPSMLSLLESAQERASARADQGDDPSRDEDEDEEADEAEFDDEIPDEDADDADADEDESQPDEDDETDSSDAPRRNRTRAYKEIQAENERLAEENTSVAKKLAKLDASFKKYGGVDIVETAMETIEKLATGKAAEVFETLPAHERTRVQKQIFEKAMTDHDNRVFGVNHVLKADFGLKEDLKPELLEKAFEFITHRINDEGEAEFGSFLDRELEFANTPEQELARTKAELERLKNPKQADNQDPTANETELQAAVRVESAYQKFHDETFNKVSTAEFEKYGFNSLSTDTPSIKDAKETLCKALAIQTDQEMRASRAFEPLLPFWMNGSTNDKYFQLNARQYETALRANLQAKLKKLGGLFKGNGVRPNDDLGKRNTNLPAMNGKTAIKPTQKARSSEPMGVATAFANARKRAGI